MILLISKRDYARVGHLLARSLNEIGIYAVSITKEISHNHHKNEQSIIYKNQNELLKFVSQATSIIWTHSILTPIDKTLQRKTKVFVFHGGTNYRRNPEKKNKIFNNIVDASIIQTGELLGLGAVNEQWLLPPIDTKLIQPEFGIHKNITIAHYPSNKIRPEHDIKGTLSINEVIKDISSIQNLNFNYRFKNAYDTTPRVSWKRNLKRMSNCDIYIESLNIDSTSDNQHDWSLTALEAAALGKIVITNFRNLERYKKEYGNCELIIANNRKQLKDVLIKLIQSPREVLIKKQQKTREWVETYHSLKAIGLRFKNIIQNTHKRISNPVIIPNHKIPNSSLMKSKRLHTSTQKRGKRIHNNTLPPSFQPPKKHKQGRAAG